MHGRSLKMENVESSFLIPLFLDFSPLPHPSSSIPQIPDKPTFNLVLLQYPMVTNNNHQLDHTDHYLACTNKERPFIEGLFSRLWTTLLGNYERSCIVHNCCSIDNRHQFAKVFFHPNNIKMFSSSTSSTPKASRSHATFSRWRHKDILFAPQFSSCFFMERAVVMIKYSWSH